MVFPFRFYGKDSHSIWFPFYYDWKSNGKDNLIVGNYYSSVDSSTNKKFGSFFPFFFQSDSPEEKTLLSIIWYSNEEKITKNYFKTLAPLYYDWKTDSSEGDLFLPFSISLKFPNKKRFPLG